jgi:hypothetical protein
MLMDSSGVFFLKGQFGAGHGVAQDPGAGYMVMWLPMKAAFRAGYSPSTSFNDVNVGQYSFAAGYAPRATGYASAALDWSTLASGSYSTALGEHTTASGTASTAGGSNANATGNYALAVGLQALASGASSVALGAGTTASGASAVSIGANTTASGDYAVAIGQGLTASAFGSVALGWAASTSTYVGSFVWGDNSTNSPLTATAGNQFNLRSSGGVRIFTNSAMTIGVSIAPGGNSWATISDRNRKQDFQAIDGESLLARLRQVPVSRWRYIGQEELPIHHIGPMAQDFHAAFGLNPDSTTINMSDLDGVTLAGVEALVARTDGMRRDAEGQDARLTVVEAENGSLRAAVRTLEARNQELEARLRRLERLLEPR